jgi:hypothetical protein
MRLTGVGTNDVRFTTCGVQKDISFIVSAGPATSHHINTSSTHQKTNLDTLPICALTAGGGADCSTVYAWFYDAYGNNVAGATCDSWSLTPKSANTTDHWESGTAGASSSIKVVTSSALDSTLTCTRTGSTENVSGGSVAGIHLYGGFKSIQATMPDNPALTAGGDFRVQNITLKGYVNGALQTMDYTINNIPVNFSTTASVALDGTAFTATPSTTCNFNAGVCQTTTYTFAFRRADSTNRSLNINVHGVSAVTGTAGDTTDPARLTTITVAPNPTVTTWTTTLPASVAADANFSGQMSLFDAYLNPTCDGTVTLTSPASASTQAPVGTAASYGAISKTSVGVFALASSSIPKASSTAFALTFNLCNAQNGSAQTRTHNIVVTEGALNNIKLLAQANRTAEQAHADAAMTNSACTYDTPTSNTNNISCNPIYAYFRDNKGNLISDATKTCTWSYTNNSATAPSGGVTAAAPPAQPNSRTFDLQHTSFIDGTVNCSSSGVTSGSATVRGGISQVELRLATANAVDIDEGDTAALRTVNAGNNNVGIHRIKLFTQQAGVKSDYTDFDLSNQIINIAHDAAKSVMAGANEVAPSSSADRDCNFTDGFCGSADGAGAAFTSAPFKLSLTQVDADVFIEARIRGVFSNQIHLAVVANNATSIDVEPIATQTAGTAFTPTIRGFDAMGNPSLRGCTGFSMTGGNSSATGTAPVFSWTTGGFNADAATTVPGATVTLSSAGTQSITFTAACATSFSAAASVTVNAAATAQNFMIGTTNATSVAQVPAYSSATPEVACTTLTVAGQTNAVECPTLYAYSYDNFGNAITNSHAHTCDWFRTPESTGTEAADSTATHSKTFASTSASPDIDMLVRCKTAGTASNDVRLYGGPAQVAVTTFPASTASGNPPAYTMTNTPIAAAWGNVWLTGVTLQSKKAGVALAMPGVAGSSQDISLTLQGTGNNTIGASPNLVTTSHVHAGTISGCAWNSNGDCSPSGSMNFKKTDAAGRILQVTVRGKTANVTLPQIVAGTAAKLNIQNMPTTPYSVDSYTTAESAITPTVTAEDVFSNTTTTTANGAANCDLSITGNDQGVYADSITYNQGANTASLKIYKAKTHTLNFSKCGITASRPLEIQEGTAKRVYLNRQDSVPTYDCVQAGDTIDTVRSCSAALTCARNAIGEPAGGYGCGTFFAYQYDKAGNPLATHTKTCTGSGYTRSFVEAAGSATETYTASGSGFRVSASNTTGFLEGDLKCEVTGSLGTRYISIVAPVQIAPPTVECTPWTYPDDGRSASATTSATPVALCYLTNNTGVTLNLASPVELSNYTADANEASITFPWRSWGGSGGGTVVNGNKAQFTVQGTKGKYSKKFKIEMTSSDATRTYIDGAEALPLRIPLRKPVSDATRNPLGQANASTAGSSLADAELAEADGSAAKSYNGTNLFRRSGLSIRLSTAASPGLPATDQVTVPPITWTDCDTSPVKRCSTNYDIQASDASPNAVYLSATNTDRLVVHPAATDFLWPYLTNNPTCYSDADGSVADKDLSACTVAVKYTKSNGADQPKGLRGVFMIRDRATSTDTTNNYYFYFLTEPIP